MTRAPSSKSKRMQHIELMHETEPHVILLSCHTSRRENTLGAENEVIRFIQLITPA